MKTFYSPDHLRHAPREEFTAGHATPAVEVPERAERVRARIIERKLGPVLPPRAFDDAPLLRVHNGAFIRFLDRAHADWTTRYGTRAGDAAVPSVWPARGLRTMRDGDIESRLGSYTFDTATPILKGTWQAARSAANVVLSAAEAVKSGEASAFALTRPPGHHASADLYGGYCYLNNVAIAAQWLADQGARPAILDVDYHHGNGTQAIFYDSSEVLFVSIHADPAYAYPHFLGFADERGAGAGEGANLNLPLARKTAWDGYADALHTAITRVRDFGPDVVLISLGLDTYERDPICRLKLTTGDYKRMGTMLKTLGKPTLFVFEGGYNLEALAENTTNVLEAFEDR
ncbi:MAG: histone deacetylase family protein [Alphaproteobacteria bacterium]|nr:histone deacetylase family protein [Alphaproteobacteria bacterium]OJU55871.1 MAG: acetylpolyamine amidohydrolase [Alphaproteobacteria bacterium 62-8]